MNPTELAVHKANTAAFIAANPTSLALIPRSLLRTGTGTKLLPGPPRAAQTVRLIDQSGVRGPFPGSITTADGTTRRVDYQLVGMPDLVIDIHDYWVDGSGIRWEVIELLPDNGYERRAQVTRSGES